MWTSCARRTSSRSKGLPFRTAMSALLNSNWSWRNAPYVVAQNTGAFLEIPSMLDEQHTRGDARGCGRLPRAPRGVCRSARRRDRPPEGRGRTERDRAGFPARQDAGADQDRARRQGRRVVAGEVPREAHQGHARRLCREGREDRDGQGRAGARSPDRRAGSASPARHQRRRRVETAARRRVLRLGVARRPRRRE